MIELTIQLTEEKNKCLYQQIYEHIRDEIRGEASCGREASLNSFSGSAFAGGKEHGGFCLRTVGGGGISGSKAP